MVLNVCAFFIYIFIYIFSDTLDVSEREREIYKINLIKNKINFL